MLPSEPSSWGQNDERRLFQQALRRDADSLGTLLESHRVPLPHFLCSCFQRMREDDLEDATFKTYLYAVAMNRCRDVLRKKHSSEVSLDAEGAPEVGKREGPERRVVKDVDVEQALSRLSPHQRLVVAYFIENGLSRTDIARLVRSISRSQCSLQKAVRLAGML